MQRAFFSVQVFWSLLCQSHLSPFVWQFLVNPKTPLNSRDFLFQRAFAIISFCHSCFITFTRTDIKQFFKESYWSWKTGDVLFNLGYFSSSRAFEISLCILTGIHCKSIDGILAAVQIPSLSQFLTFVLFWTVFSIQYHHPWTSNCML